MFVEACMSDNNMTGPGDLVVGTAGHIDHGKTELVRALTGMDTDRLAEEKRRGISIDLGFAHLELDGGRRHISFIDVPGHERFVRNMLAGVAGIQAVLLVVAANELVKPQTREHLEICRLLGIDKGIVVLTKSDLVGAEELVRARAVVASLVKDSFLDGAPIIAVSARTGAGLPQLCDAIARLTAAVDSGRTSKGIARVPIDRSFSVRGFGTVVTGTLWSGSLLVGDSVRVYPQSRAVRIRGLQVNGRSETAVHSGHRTAVNLSGIDAGEIERGSVLIGGADWEGSRRIQVDMDWLDDNVPPKPREQFLFHLATAEKAARLKILGSVAGANRLWAELRFSEAVFALPGDRFVLRRPSPSSTVGGGMVVDAYPPRLNRRKLVPRLERLARAGLEERIGILVDERENGVSLEELSKLMGRSADEVKSAVTTSSGLLFASSLEHIVSKRWLTRKREIITGWLAKFHQGNPALAAAPTSAARLSLDANLFHFVVDGFPAIRITREGVALATHNPQHSSSEIAALSRIEASFRKAGYQPASAEEVLRAAGPGGKQARDLLQTLIRTKRLVRVSDELVFHADVIRHMRDSLSSHRGRKFTVAEFKSWTQTSRKHAIPLLEYLDHQRVTRRDGDMRIVL
jgi:selenocysteine-specific elongation factor